jgi:iron complex outermembrane receptor protein
MIGAKFDPMAVCLVAVLLLFVVLPPTSIAETDRETASMDAVVVTAERPQRSRETGDVNLESTPSFYSLITRDEFEGKIESLAEVIEKEAGVQVRRAGGLGSFSTVSLRGSTSDQVLVFLDGILLNDASGGGVDLSTISLSDIDSIEIYKGVTPASFGRSSLGGVVNIRTLRSRKGIRGSVGAGYGSFDTWKLSGFVNHKPGRWDYLASADYLESENDFKFLNDKGTSWNPADDRMERRHNAQFHENNFLGKMGRDLTEKSRVEFMDQWFSKKQGLPAWNNSEFAKTSFETDRNIATVKLTANDIGPYHFNTSTFLDYAHKVEEYDDSEGQIGLGRQLNRYTTDRFGGHGIVDWHSEWNTLSLMLDIQTETYSPEDLLNPDNRIPESTRDSFSIGVQDNLYFFRERLIVTPAVRYTRIHDERNSAIDMWGRSLEGSTKDETSWSPQLGLKYLVFEGLTLKTNIGRYVREPSFFELFGDRGFFTGNADLKSEKGTNFDVGFEGHWAGPDKWLKNLTWSAAWFHNTVNDLISRVYDARGVGKSVNISSSEISGVETSLKVDLLEHFRFIGNATWQNPVQQNEIEAFDGNILPGRFQESYLARLEGFYGPAKVYGEYITESGLFYDAANLLKAGDKREINLGASFLFRSFTVTLEARNVGDERYEDFNGYPMPGRSGRLTVQYKF